MFLLLPGDSQAGKTKKGPLVTETVGEGGRYSSQSRFSSRAQKHLVGFTVLIAQAGSILFFFISDTGGSEEKIRLEPVTSPNVSWLVIG